MQAVRHTDVLLIKVEAGDMAMETMFLTTHVVLLHDSTILSAPLAVMQGSKERQGRTV